MLNNSEKVEKTISYVCKLRFPKYPSYCFPVFVFLKIIKQILYDIKVRSLKFRVVPIPNQLFDKYTAKNLVKSEHTLFVNKSVFGQYFVEAELIWTNLLILVSKQDATSKREDNKIVSTILNKQNFSVTFQVSTVSGIPMNVIFVKENLYYNLLDKYKLNHHFCAYLQRIPENQQLPKIISKGNIFLYNTPYELSADMIDYIIGKYFETPQFLYRNHTYQIDLNAKILGSNFYTKNFAIFSNLTKLYFKCVNLESKESSFELCGIVCKSFTILLQTTTLNTFLPRQHLDDSVFIECCPRGFGKYFDELKASMVPFLDGDNNSLIENQIYPVFMLQGDRGSGKAKILQAVAKHFGIQIYHADCSDIMTNVLSQTEAKLATALSKSKICSPLIICMHNFEVFGIDNEGHEDLRILTSMQSEISNIYNKKMFTTPVILVALANEKHSNKAKINSLFLEIIKVNPPNPQERFNLLKWIGVKENFPINDQNLHKIAEQTQGFIFDDLKLLYSKAIQAMQNEKSVQLEFCHFEKCIDELQNSFSDSLGAPKVPKVLWSEIGGLAKLKTEIQNSIGLPLKHKKLMGKNMRRSGILLYGPPGTGKTLIAKAVATECNLSFLSVQGPELLNMYVGQSEQNVREVFERARSASPCVLFLDELDSLAPNRGVSGDSGGVMDRVVSQMLSEMDGISKDPEKQIFILAATNRPDLIDPALLRPGRFDKLLYVGPCVVKEDKESVLKAITGKFNLAKELSLNKIAEMLKEDVTGADLYSICSNAWLSAVRRIVMNEKDEEKDITAEKVVVNMDDFKKACENFIPSINKADMEYFNQLRSNFT